jgi:hypothetical protein
MNDRIYQALTEAGLSTSPLSILDHASAYASAFFALYDTELVYHEGGKNSRVPLRDVTRIHSDREGVLRVETSERTAVTASLLGYDPGRVQAFFQQVRDVTARAKELPVLPLNQARPEPAFVPTSAPVSANLPSTTQSSTSLPSAGMPGLSAYMPATTPSTQNSPAPVFTPAVQAAPQPSSFQPLPKPASAATVVAVPSSPGSAPAGNGALGGTAPLPTRRDAPRPEPVVISSMPPVSDPPAFQERAGERNRQASRVAVRTAEPPQLSPSPAFGPTGEDHTQGALVSVPAAVRESGASDGSSSELLRRADSVQGLARTVGLLAVVLGLAAIALAYFQWQATGSTTAGTLSAIWTLLAGGVGAVALLAFAEALRLLSALARSSLARSSADRPV